MFKKLSTGIRGVNGMKRVKGMKRAMLSLILKKDRGGKEIIVEVGLAVIAVALLLVFRKEISTLVTTLVQAATEKINALFSL